MRKALLHKMGEVLAFSEYSTEFYKKNSKPLLEAFKSQEIEDIVKKNENFAQEILTMVSGQDSKEATKKAQKSAKKFKAMEKIYLEGTKDPTELLEWLGFVEGSAMVHWNLVSELAVEEKMKKLQKTGQDAEKFHDKNLHKIMKEITKTED